MVLNREQINRFLNLAYDQALYAVGNTQTNPPVGAVVVNESGKVIGSGYTRPAGGNHAEVEAIDDALNNAGAEQVARSTIFVTLEPCSHFGKTPPCTLKIVDAGIKQVVITDSDSSSKVTGTEFLRTKGVEVVIADQKEFTTQKLWTTTPFNHLQVTGRPYTIVKWAQTADGYLAPEKGPSGPVSSVASKEIVYRMRHLFYTTLVSPGTIVEDKPLLNARIQGVSGVLGGPSGSGSDLFLRKMLLKYENVGQTSPGYGNLNYQNTQRVFWLPRYSDRWDREQLDQFCQRQVAIGPGELFFPADIEQLKLLKERCVRSIFNESVKDIDVDYILSTLGEKGITQVFVEAGPATARQLVGSGLADMIMAFVSDESRWEKGRSTDLSKMITPENGPEVYHKYLLHDRVEIAGGDTLYIYKV